MNDGTEPTLNSVMAKIAPALAGAGSSATFAGLGAEQWAIIVSVLTALYVTIQLILCGPKLIIMIQRIVAWRRRRSADETDGAGA